MAETRKTTDIVFREDLYPRFEPKQQLIQQYAYSLEFLPPITINQDNILIDGFHRWKAHQLNNGTEIKAEIIQTTTDKEIKRLAYRLNSNHGLQLTQDEKRKYAVEMAEEMTNRELCLLLSVDESSISRWTKGRREELDAERDRKIIELYLRAWNTQASIAEELGVTQQTVSNTTKKMQLQDFGKDFKPYIYNIWNLQKQDNAVGSHFGSFPQVFMENLLYFHTQPLDIVYDPFAGGGTTIDACKRMLRRYYCSDRLVKPGREKDILQHDIVSRLPDGMPKPDLVFLDPPYLALANKEYSEDNTDLGNMPTTKFYELFNQFITELISKKHPQKLAYVIRPIWEMNSGEGWNWIDPMFNFYDLIKAKYHIAARYVLPYSTQQYSALWVDRAKKQNKCLILNRELTIFEVNNG